MSHITVYRKLITCIVQKRSLEAVKTSFGKRVGWGDDYRQSRLLGLGHGDCRVGVEEIWRLPKVPWLSLAVSYFLGGKRVCRHRCYGQLGFGRTASGV